MWTWGSWPSHQAVPEPKQQELEKSRRTTTDPGSLRIPPWRRHRSRPVASFRSQCVIFEGQLCLLEMLTEAATTWSWAICCKSADAAPIPWPQRIWAVFNISCLGCIHFNLVSPLSFYRVWIEHNHGLRGIVFCEPPIVFQGKCKKIQMKCPLLNLTSLILRLSHFPISKRYSEQTLGIQHNPKLGKARVKGTHVAQPTCAKFRGNWCMISCCNIYHNITDIQLWKWWKCINKNEIRWQFNIIKEENGK